MKWVQWHQGTLSECFYTIASPVHPSQWQSIPLVYTHPHTMALSNFVIKTRGHGVMEWVQWHQGTLSECFYTIASPVHPFLCQSIPLVYTHPHTMALSNFAIKTRGHGVMLWVQWHQGTLSECFYTIASPVHPSLCQSIPLVYTHPHTMALSNFVIKTRGHGVMLWVQWHQGTLSECFYTIASPVHPSLCQSIPLVYTHPHTMALSNFVIKTRGHGVMKWVQWHQGTLSECFYTIASPVHPSLCQSIPLVYTHPHTMALSNFVIKTRGHGVMLWVQWHQGTLSECFYTIASPVHPSLCQSIPLVYTHPHTMALSNLVIKTRGHGVMLWVQWHQGTLSECFYTIASPVHPSLCQSIPLVYTHPHTMALSNLVIKTRGHGVMLWVQWHQGTLSECFYTIASPVHPSLCQSILLVYTHTHTLWLCQIWSSKLEDMG